jgi:hypothetical protein
MMEGNTGARVVRQHAWEQDMLTGANLSEEG